MRRRIEEEQRQEYVAMGPAERVPAANASLPHSPSQVTLTSETANTESPPVPPWTIVLLVAATFGVGMAMVVPMTYSLAVRLDMLAPGRADILGMMFGIGSAVTLVVAPLTGILSDRTRSRFGRRRPFTVAGLVVGAASVAVMATAPNIWVLTMGWVLSTVGWGTAGASVGNWQADRLPASQRGKVSGLTNLMMQISPVVGILLVAPLRGEPFLVFAIPAAVAVVLIGLFVAFAPEADSRSVRHSERLTPGAVLKSYLFRPKDSPDFAWNWLGRFIFFLGLTSTTSFSVYFYSQRLDLALPDVAGVMALTSALSVGTATLGSIGVGWLSDRTARRRPFILLGTLVFATGSIISAFAGDLASIIVGTLVSSLGIASFSSVGQALVLDVLPDRERQAGRYMAINMFAQKIPGVIAPVCAPLLLLIGGGEQNFTALYLSTALLSAIGGILIATRVKGVR
ncbi:MFS transporter [Arthrobacter sp. EH-1B-1]|uniref:MFS transporter n=1 Tax=Arthrobacter vasquezii TaxID=2977629 RepID=A0ABT6CVV9_9MICC|nr:MFS transporter [Arthrobacter vasquezii]MDF9277632.1 MFS transporter [Arthrobacter vasquezii]